MPSLSLKPTHKAVTAYYDSLATFAKLGVKHEGAVRSAFQELLESCARQFDWKLVPEYALKRKGQAAAKADGALLDPYGLWEAKERRENITPKALTLFQIFYDDDGITREAIFHYVYALLHHPTYRTRYAENLKRELPRIPFIGVAADVSRLKSSSGKKEKKSEPTDVGCYSAAFFPLASVASMQGGAKPDHDAKASAKLFHAVAAAGKQMAELHVNYESAKEFPLQRHENPAVKLDWRVEAMKLSKDKASLCYNDFLTLSGIPAEVFDYRLGNRSALEWVIDQYRVARDEQGKIASDPNRMDDEEYIVRLIGQVITVSLETQKFIGSLPEVKAP
jgi:predicted helicase